MGKVVKTKVSGKKPGLTPAPAAGKSAKMPFKARKKTCKGWAGLGGE